MEDINGFSSAIKRNIAEAPKSEKRPWSFNSMGLDKFVLMGIRNKGYRLPTAIQRQTIPIIIEGRDVVAMAKTGSGKTACFLIPLLEKLQSRPRNGVLGVILSPTRELAMQTVKHARELGKYIDFNITCVIGGDSMDSQFLALHQSPDVIVATPGRFIHLCVEMDLHLSTLEYVVFDEADRLFEMGFHEQIKEILKRLPESKQTLMFSATLPKTVVEFAEAGLQHPVLTRLDVESKLPEELKLKFLHCRPYERYTALLILLKYIIPKSSQTIVFAATHHHIDFITMLLSEAGISNTFAYSSLDATARKINTIKFLKKKVSVLVVTDVAARGLDIPSVDSVINFHFPGTSKLFIHRVGRCARAGQSGTAYSIVSTEDLSHVVDLHLFLNRPFNVLNQNVFGNISQDLIDEEQSEFLKYITKSHIVNAHSLSERAYKKYLSSRPSASREYKKIINENDFALLQPLDNCRNQIGKANCELILKMKDYRPSETVFELNAHGNNLSHIIMKEKRFHVNKQIRKHGDERLNFKDERKSLKDGAQTINKQYFVPYEPTDKRTEEGFTINSFTHQARDLEFSIKDRSECNKCIPGVKRWDRLRKKMVTAQNLTTGKIRTEFGLWIPATYKTGRYQEWKQKSKCHESLFHEGRTNTNLNSNHKAKAKKMINKRIELQNINQIAKRRLRVEVAKKRENVNRSKKKTN